MEIFHSIGAGTLFLLLVCLIIALGFEFVNGFHDTANAVATVIYTRSMPPAAAVIWSGFVNFLGVMVGGTAVAFGIVHLLPVQLLVQLGQGEGLFIILSLLISAIVWNIGTWYLGLPASSSHALIGSILGVGVASALFAGQGVLQGLNWPQVQKVGLSLLISPVVGFVLAAALLQLSKLVLRNRALFEEPHGEAPPPLWIRATLFLTCTGVSFAHGSNDGQKGIGLIMLILIAFLPAQYAINPRYDAEQLNRTVMAVWRLESVVGRAPSEKTEALLQRLDTIRTGLEGRSSVEQMTRAERTALRGSILNADDALGKFEKTSGANLSPEDRAAFKKDRAQLSGSVDFVAWWVVLTVATALGLGTTIGWKRVVVTVGEKIGKAHLTYAQGACAEIVAMVTIATADKIGLPVSTTHVLSSGVAGTMAANRSGLQGKTVRNIALAWVLTLPATLLLSALLFALTVGSTLKSAPAPDTIRHIPAQTVPVPRPAPLR